MALSDARESPFPAPSPDFAECGNCGADAEEHVSWDNADGWCCSKCGACDADA